MRTKQAFPRTAGAPVESLRVAANSKSWQLNLPTAVTVWASIVLVAAFSGVWLGFAGRPFALALGVAAGDELSATPAPRARDLVALTAQGRENPAGPAARGAAGAVLGGPPAALIRRLFA